MMRQVCFAISVSVILLTGCQSSRTQIKVDSTQPYVLTSAQVQQVKDGVLARLKDPYSAHFGSIKSAKLGLSNEQEAKQGYIVCGEVNSKNSYGGYVGMTPFVGAFKLELKEFTNIVLGGEAVITAEVIKTCRQAGIEI